MAGASKPRQFSTVAIPLGQGQVFNPTRKKCNTSFSVATPLGQGQVFNNQQ